MPARSPVRLTPAEMVDVLRSPTVVEDLGSADAPLVMVEGDWSTVPAQLDPAWFDRLRTLSVVTTAIVRAQLGEGGSLLIGGFDLVLVDDDIPPPDGAGPISALDEVIQGVAANPRAALVLAQLLRAGSGGAAGLLAESLAYGLLQGGPEFQAWLQAHEARPPAPAVRPPVRVDRFDDRLEVVLDRPEVRNAIDREVRDGLVEMFTAASADPTGPPIVLRGEGPSFSSGGALWEFGTVPDSVTGHVVRSTRLPARAMAACAGRLRAAVHGPCVGAGVELPAIAATVHAAPDTTFRLPEVGMGLVPGAGGTVSLPRRIGRHRTAFLAISGREIDAPTALSWGLVDQVGQPHTR